MVNNKAASLRRWERGSRIQRLQSLRSTKRNKKVGCLYIRRTFSLMLLPRVFQKDLSKKLYRKLVKETLHKWLLQKGKYIFAKF